MITDEPIRAPIPSKVDRIVEEHVRVGRTSKRPGNIFDGSRDFRSERFGHSSSKKRKAKGLAALFTPPTDITFVGTLEEAKMRGRRHSKWLLVNVQVYTVLYIVLTI